LAHDVFISHSAKDKIIADALCAALESAGIRCWIAPRGVMPGMEWGRSIIEAIEQARIMVLIFTANANASPQIRREVEGAANHEVVILPFRVESVRPDKSLEYFIGNVHWLDALTPPLEAHIKSLTGTVKVLLAQTKPRVENVLRVPSTFTREVPERIETSAASQRPAHEVFICHSTKDEVKASAICAALEAEGLQCWIAPRDLISNLNWEKCMIEAIKQARIMVLALTADANVSPRILREVELATRGRVRILIMQIEDEVTDGPLDYFFNSGAIWFNARTPPLESHFGSLAAEIKAHLAQA